MGKSKNERDSNYKTLQIKFNSINQKLIKEDRFSNVDLIQFSVRNIVSRPDSYFQPQLKNITPVQKTGRFNSDQVEIVAQNRRFEPQLKNTKPSLKETESTVEINKLVYNHYYDRNYNLLIEAFINHFKDNAKHDDEITKESARFLSESIVELVS